MQIDIDSRNGLDYDTTDKYLQLVEMGLAFVIDIVVVAVGMNTGHMGLGICIDVPSGVGNNDLDLETGIPLDTLDHDIADWDSIFSLFHDHYVLDLCY